MNLVRWDPFDELVTIGHRLNRNAFGPWAPPVDIFEKDDHLVFRAEIPGAQPKDLDVRVENGVLTLHGERRRDAEVDEKNAHRTERSYGSFTRSFSLPTTVDASKVAATYKDGILEVSVPKAEAAKPKRIEIRAA